MSDFRRGGFSSPYNDYSTWINNGNYQLTDARKYNIDGSWLDNGDYDRAFKGYPSKKTVNIFLGGGYTAPSWQSTFLSTGIGVGIRGLGLWLMSSLFKRNQPQQTTVQATVGNPFPNYFNNVSAFFTSSQPFGLNLNALTGPSNGTTPPVEPKKENKDVEAPKPKDDGGSPEGPKGPEDDNGQGNDEKVKSLKATNDHPTSNLDVKGAIISESAPAEGQKYPQTIVTFDTTSNSNAAKDANGKVKGNKYTYDFKGVDKDTGKPIYKVIKAEIYVNKDNKDKIQFTPIEYLADNNDFVKNDNDTYSVKADNEFSLAATNPSNSAIRNTSYFDFENGEVMVYEMND